MGVNTLCSYLVVGLITYESHKNNIWVTYVLLLQMRCKGKDNKDDRDDENGDAITNVLDF